MARFSNPDPGMDRPKGKDLSVLKSMLGFLKPYWARVLGAAVALMVTAGATLTIGKGLEQLIDAGLSGESPGALETALLGLAAIGAIIAVGSYIRFYLVTWLGERVVADLRTAVFEKIVRLDQSFFEVTKTGEILSRLTTDTTLLQTVVGSSFSLALRNAITMTGGLVLMFVTNPKLAAVCLFIVPLSVAPILLIGRRVRVYSRLSQDRVADVGAFAEESLSGIRTLQAFTHEERESARFGEEVEEAFETARKRAVMRSILTATVTVMIFLGLGSVIWVGGGDVLAGRITGGELGAFLFYALMVAMSAGIVTEVYGDLQRAAGATERLMDLLASEPEIRAPAVPQPVGGITPTDTPGRVTFEDVTFHYPSRPDKAALAGFSLDVKPGETVALVGPSGAGKSTVFQLLLRFYDPATGTVRLDGTDLKDAQPQDVRSRLALVPQEPFLFGDTAKVNIHYGNPGAPLDQLFAAAKDARAEDFIRELPNGYDTYLGEKGVRLSGGQRQRVSIARAILRDPSVLLLDEATSALDAENERLVQEALTRLKKGRTTLVIAHRLATVVSADRIVVMDGGRVLATGTHAELLKDSPLYARLAELQFSEPAAAQ